MSEHTRYVVVRKRSWEEEIIGPPRFERSIAEAQALVLTADESTSYKFYVGVLTWTQPEPEKKDKTNRV